jgi:thioredoxin reductase (NADPH)
LSLYFTLPELNQVREQSDTDDVDIVGAGPAGLTAAIYCARGRLSTCVLERNMAGGQMSLTELIENFPGFPDGVSGFNLAELMKRQATRFGAEVREITAVESITPHEDGTFTVTTDQDAVTGRALLLAPGVDAKRSGIPGEAEFVGRGVSWCATCDGALYRGKEVAVIGGGDSAVEEGLFLAKFADAVHVIHRRDELRANKTAQERAFANPKMHFIWDSVPRRINGETSVVSIEYQNVKTLETATLPVSGVFFYIGQLPNTDFLRGLVDLDAEGYIKSDALLCTSRPGIFAAGDARPTPIKQIAWAVGEGALAGVQLEKYLDSLECPSPEAAAAGRAAAGVHETEPVPGKGTRSTS